MLEKQKKGKYVHIPRENCTLILLGAGASRGSALNHPPPTIKDFFTDGMTRAQGDYTSLWEVLSNLGYRKELLASGKVNIEEIYSELASLNQWISGVNPLLVRQKLGGKIYSLSPSVLMEAFILDALHPSNEEAINRPCKKHIDLFNELSPGDAVISFNYDLIADSALKSMGCWREVDGYGFISISAYTDDTYGDSPAVKLLKLHGSINWSNFGDSINVYSLTDWIKNSDQGRLINFQASEFDKQVEYFGDEWKEHVEIQIDRQPAKIIAPALSKNIVNSQRQLKEVWDTAGKAIKQASKIVVIGFSFAPIDVHFLTFIKLQLKENPLNRIQVDVIDPDETVIQRIESLSPNLEVRRIAEFF